MSKNNVKCFIVFVLLVSNLFAQNSYDFDAVEQDRLIKIVQSSDGYSPEFSTAGFFQVDASVREAANFNLGWRFIKKDVQVAYRVGFDDSDWAVVNVPHGFENLPLDASGGVNYQGPAWYRKHFYVSEEMRGKKHFIHFEAIMGKSKIFVNGQLIKEHFGGYHPIHIDVTDFLNFGSENIIAVCTDNSDDPIYPPGKSQKVLDFCYFGGIYRDVHFITTNKIYVSNANDVNRVAGGGLFVVYDNLTEKSIDVIASVDIENETAVIQQLSVEYKLEDKEGKVVAKQTEKLLVQAGKNTVSKSVFTVKKPHLWSVDDPYLHNLYLTIKDKNGNIVDAFRNRIGLRTIEFKGKDGFYLNGKPFESVLIGANRHQDYAYLGNALPNTTHWCDAQKLRQANMRIIRNAHYPQDPAFMDACDELGLFVIVNIPGWQFWNKNPIFAERIMSDIRNMVRRDRNHASVLLWEPSLNESWYPAEYDQYWHDATHEEYPYPGCYTTCDHNAKGQSVYDLVFYHPGELAQVPSESRTTFTREWSDCPDNWNAQNSPSRVSKSWGEVAMLEQASHIYKPDFPYTSLWNLYQTDRQHFGGSIWHSFDHQRGYHPDAFLGGIMDATRQPKTSYYLFRSQMPIESKIDNIKGGAFVRIACEMTPFSSSDVTVFSNCDEVRLYVMGEEVGIQSTVAEKGHRKPVVFKDVFHFQDIRKMEAPRNSDKSQPEASIVAEGLINGKVVARSVKIPSGRPTQILLRVDDCNVKIEADGTSIVPVVAYLTDDSCRVKRLTEEYIRFSVEGSGELVNSDEMQANPVKVVWGEAIALVRVGSEAGVIKVKAEVLMPGAHSPASAVVEINTVPSTQKFIYTEKSIIANKEVKTQESEDIDAIKQKLQQVERELNDFKLKEVERQQADFGEKKD